MRLLPAIILAVAVVLTPVIWLVGQRLLMPDGFDGPAVDSGARIEIEMMRQQIEMLQEKVIELEDRIAALPSRDQVAPDTGAEWDVGDAPFPRDGVNQILDSYAQVVSLAGRRNVNSAWTLATPNFLEQFLGRPREVLSDDCEPMTNERLRAMLVVDSVGPIRVQMLQPAIDSLRGVFERVKATDIDLYERISTAGSLCVRRIRGTQDRLSSHSFGLAVDLNIDGHLDTLGDGYTQLGLTILADFFEAEGWIWGAGFSREDSMHFEVSRELLERWRAEGMI